MARPIDDDDDYDDRPAPRRRATGDVSTQAKNKVAAGICGILLGSFGVHKFILGMTTPGVIMLCITLFSCFTLSFIPWIIGLIEGITYLTKSDEEFVQTYVIEKKQWF